MFYDIYILTNTGICLFHKKLYDSKERNLSADLISGFFSAIFLFTSNFVDKKLEIIEIEYLRLIFREKDEYIFVAFVDEYESIAQVKDILDKIIENFFQIYGENLKKWDSDLSLFNGFDKQIEDILTQEDINRMFLIEKIGNLLNFEVDSEIEGICIFTSRAELMFSSILNEKLSQFLIKMIENKLNIGFKFEQIIISHDNRFFFVENLSETLISAILIKPNYSIDRARVACKILFKKLKNGII